MSEKLLKIMLDELEVVRIICKKCKTCFEFPLDNLDDAFKIVENHNKRWECPHCHDPIMGDSTGAPTGGPFHLFLKGIRVLKDSHDKIDVQFVVKEE